MNDQPKQLRLGTRASSLAVVQSQIIGNLVGGCEIVKIVSEGDRIAGPLRDHGGKGLFTNTLENALRDKKIDLAVHSAKDVPTEISDEFKLFFITERLDCGEVLVSNGGHDLDTLPSGSTVGTCSLRRRNQLLKNRGDLNITSIRGNIDTRIRKVIEREVDACVLARAGLIRSGLIDKHEKIITDIALLPAAGQGALAVEALAENRELCDLLGTLEHVPTRQALTAERWVLEKVEANCHSSIAVNISLDGLAAHSMTSQPDGSDYREFTAHGKDHMDTAEKLLAQMTS